jgi:hypothetical protein
MKTKIIFLIIAIKALTAATAFAQEKDQPIIYEKVYGGYSLFSPGSDNVSQNQGSLSDPGVNGPFKQSKGGAGSGLNYGFGIAAPVGKLWIAGIDLNYLDGKKLTFSQSGTVVGEASTAMANGRHSVLSIIPNISYKILPMPNYFIYTKLGLMLAVKTMSNYSFNSSFSSGGSSDILADDEQFKYGLNIGLQAAAGVQFKLTSRISGFCELTGNFLTVKPTSAFTKNSNVDNDPEGQSFYYTYNITFQKASSGTINRQTTTTTVGNVQTNVVTENDAAFSEHINSIVLNVGIVVGFR